MRYIVRGAAVVEHASNEGPLLSDAFSAVRVNPELLQPRETQ